MSSIRTQCFVSLMVILVLATMIGAPYPTQALDQVSLVWAKSMGGTDWEIGVSIATDSLGNVYTTGYFSETVDFDPSGGIFNLTSAGEYDIFISKLDSNGNLIWAKSMGGTGSDLGESVAVDSTGNVYTTGHFKNAVDFDPGAGTFILASVGSEDVFVSKLDTNGNFIWAKQMGGTGMVQGYSNAIDSNNNIYTTGTYYGDTDFDPGPGTFLLTGTRLHPDMFISKLDSNGNFVWAMKLGGTSDTLGESIATDSLGNVFTTGTFVGTTDFNPSEGVFTLTSAGGNDIFISKLDSNGNFVWAKSMEGTGNDVGDSIAIDSSGTVYTTGYFSETVDFDSGAGTFNLTSAGISDIFISKLDSNGNFVWAKSMGGIGGDSGTSIAIDSLGTVYTTGYFSETVDFDSGAGTFNLTSAGISDIFISKLDSNGNFVWAKSMGGTEFDYGADMTCDKAENILYITGGYAGTADFDPGPGETNLTSVGSSDIYIASYVDQVTPVISINIDIKPGSNTNPINLGAKGVIPVAVLTTDEFDAADVDPSTMLFAEAAPLRWTMVDADWDGEVDLLFHFDVQKLQLTQSSVEAYLTGKTYAGTPVEGADLVKIVPFVSGP